MPCRHSSKNFHFQVIPLFHIPRFTDSLFLPHCLCDDDDGFSNSYIFSHAILCCHAGTTNNILRLSVVDVSSPADAQLQCTFLSEFTGSAHCTVRYGTDPTYMNLPYSAESTETGTAGDTVSVVLREELSSSTVYYYTVSLVSGDVTVTVQGSFTTPQHCKYHQLLAFSDYQIIAKELSGGRELTT